MSKQGTISRYLHAVEQEGRQASRQAGKQAGSWHRAEERASLLVGELDGRRDGDTQQGGNMGIRNPVGGLDIERGKRVVVRVGISVRRAQLGLARLASLASLAEFAAASREASHASLGFVAELGSALNCAHEVAALLLGGSAHDAVVRGEDDAPKKDLVVRPRGGVDWAAWVVKKLEGKALLLAGALDNLSTVKNDGSKPLGVLLLVVVHQQAGFDHDPKLVPRAESVTELEYAGHDGLHRLEASALLLDLLLASLVVNALLSGELALHLRELGAFRLDISTHLSHSRGRRWRAIMLLQTFA
eukprot:m.262372 g.262372  ORF g.262372 m.262372 type:complete len:302 (-) comp11047_c0_seq32:50-955(-)